MASAAPAAPRIAVVRLDNLGDHVLGAGLLPALRAMYPLSRIVQFAPVNLADLYVRCPAASHLNTLPAKEHYLPQMDRFTELLRELNSAEKFDLVINPRFAEDHYLAGPLCQALAAPGGRVVGFRQDASPYAGYDPNRFYTELIEAPADLHASRYAGAVVGHLGGSQPAEPVIWFTPEDIAEIRERFATDTEPYVVVGCGASFPYKLPAQDLFAHLIERLTSAWGRRVLLAGTRADLPVAARILEDFPSARIVSTLGALRLYQLAALLSGAELYVGPDAGPMHMAAAAGIPVIELGWVPAGYPRTSRGSGTAGWCWSPWTPRGVTVGPDPAVFSRRMGDPDFARQPICGIPTAMLDAALMSSLRSDSAAT